MCSTRSDGVVRTMKGMFAAALTLSVLGGCQARVPPPAQSPLNDTPLVIDPAMQKRDDWDRSTAQYASGSSVAGGTGYVFQTHETVPPTYRRLLDAPVAVLNFLAMPIGLFTNSPFGKQIDRGESVPQTYTGNPPTPGGPVRRGGEPAPEVIAPAQPTTPVRPDETASPAVQPAEPVMPAEPLMPAEPATPVPSATEPPPVEPVPPPPAPPVVEPPPVEIAPPVAPPVLPDAPPVPPAPSE